MHFRIMVLMTGLMVINAISSGLSIVHVLETGPSVLILFGFEVEKSLALSIPFFFFRIPPFFLHKNLLRIKEWFNWGRIYRKFSIKHHFCLILFSTTFLIYISSFELIQLVNSTVPRSSYYSIFVYCSIYLVYHRFSQKPRVAKQSEIFNFFFTIQYHFFFTLIFFSFSFKFFQSMYLFYLELTTDTLKFVLYLVCIEKLWKSLPPPQIIIIVCIISCFSFVICQFSILDSYFLFLDYISYFAYQCFLFMVFHSTSSETFL